MTVSDTVSNVAYVTGSLVRIINSATNWMEGNITGWTTDQMTVNVVRTGGSGTYASWTISVAGEQGAQGNQGYQGASGGGYAPEYRIQGAQWSLTQASGLQNVPGFTTSVLTNNATYEWEAVIGSQKTAGSQGIQWCPQCNVAGGSVAGIARGSQGAQGATSAPVNHWLITTLGLQGHQNNMAAGLGEMFMKGIFIAPSTGSPQFMIQCKCLQSSQTAYVKPNSYLKIQRIS
jgi:hypothetical protein